MAARAAPVAIPARNRVARAAQGRKRPISGDEQVRVQLMAQVFRDARHNAGFSLEELAERSAVSSGLISQIERGFGNPSFVTLLKLRSALEVPWEALFQGPSDAKMLVRPRDRQQLRVKATRGLFLELLTPSFEGPYRFYAATYPARYDSTAVPTRVEGQQSIHVLRGRLSVFVGDDEYELRPGDTITFPASVPHSTRNPARVRCDVLMVTSQAG